MTQDYDSVGSVGLEFATQDPSPGPSPMFNPFFPKSETLILRSDESKDIPSIKTSNSIQNFYY